MEELKLEGGRSGVKVVKIGNTIHREQGENSIFSQKLLQHLEKKDIDFVPKFLGVDENNREILSYIDGEVSHTNIEWSNEMLDRVIHMLKKFHDATKGSDLTGNHEVVCHNDFAPWNTVIHKGLPVAMIDFDGAKPGTRVHDLAYTLWTFLGLDDESKTDFYLYQIKRLAGAYGTFDRNSFFQVLLKHQEETLAMRKDKAVNDATREDRAFSAQKVREIESQILWTTNHEKDIERTLQI